MILPLINDKNNNKYMNSGYHIENMPVAVPNSFYRKYEHNERYDNNYGYYNNNLNNNDINSLMEENKSKSYYLIRLEQKIKRLENINNIFLNILRENNSINNRNFNRNYSSNDLYPGSYPYLSFDKYRNKSLLYLNKNIINNNKIIDGKYKNNYLVPILPKYNSVADNNRLIYLLNNEKLKYFDKDSRNDSRPYFQYNNTFNYMDMNIPQKINSVQYFNNKIEYKKYNTYSKINAEINSDKKTLSINNKDIKNKINNSSNTRLSKIENIQKNQKKGIDNMFGKSKESKSGKTSKKDNSKKNDKKSSNNKKDKEKKESKESKKKKESDDEDSEEDDDESDDDDDEDEKEVDIKDISSN